MSIAVTMAHPCFTAPFPNHLPPLTCSSIGAGYATIADGDDPSTIYWNPAGIALMNQMSMNLTISSYEGGKPASWSALIANSAHREASQFGIGFIRRHSSNNAGEFTSFELLNPLAYRAERSHLAWGFTPKFVGENFGEKWVYGIKLDGGISYQTERQSRMVLSLAMQNFAGSNLRAFKWDTWGGVKSGSDNNTLRVYIQTRLDKPFDMDYISRNYRIGARLESENNYFPDLRAGILRDNGVVHYTGSFSYQTKSRTNIVEYALVWQPDKNNAIAHFITYAYHIKGGSPSSPGGMSW